MGRELARYGAGAARCGGLLDSSPETYIADVTFSVEIEREDDGRWLAEVPALPGVMAYGQDRAEAVARVQAWSKVDIHVKLQQAGESEISPSRRPLTLDPQVKKTALWSPGNVECSGRR